MTGDSGWLDSSGGLLPPPRSVVRHLVGRLSSGPRDWLVQTWLDRHPLDPATEQAIVDEVARCWDGVPLPRPLPDIVDRMRRLLLLQLLETRGAAQDGAHATGRHLRFSSLAPLEQALSRGKSAMLLTPSFGRWQTIAPALARRGYQVGLLDLRPASRSGQGGPSASAPREVLRLPTTGSARPLVRFASEPGRVVVALGDEGLGPRWAEGTLLGRPARVGSTPFELARRLGLAIVPCFTVHDGEIPRLVVEKELKISDTGRGDADLDTTVGRWLRMVERYARRHPDHYLAFLHARSLGGAGEVSLFLDQ